MLTETEATLLAKLVKPAQDLATGTHIVDRVVTLHLRGTVTKGPDKTRPATTSMPWKRITAVLLDHLGYDCETAIGLVIDAARSALDDNDDIRDRLSRYDEAEARITAMLREGLPPQQVRGDTRAAGEVVEVALPAVVDAA